MFTYSAICDVPEETLLHVTALLHVHRREIRTRAGRRSGTVRTQAKLVLRWFRDDAPIRLLAMEAGLPISTSYRYLHEAIDVIAEQAPDLHEVLDRAKAEQWSHVTLDGTLIAIDRVDERNEAGHHRWYSGKHKTQGGNVQILADPGGFPVWSSEAEPGSVHDITAARAHCLGALYKSAADGVPTLADKGYEGAGIGVHTPVKGRGLAVENQSYNMLLTAARAIGERANAELKQRWRCLRRIRLCPNRIGAVVAAAIVLSTLQRGNY
ncbi:transposase family protein [Candidatus Mycobacterium methanotrophicum]|uniref:Transposase n=3 Tax=Candidatus Mycobacterium methanotrophicum TaxID=2943498 RepID=A0ABY4QN99_9MYCO|nr:transposase family protein [Candidatus Mycobacterium methanotrophicum]UQX11257.1 transposase [Candidatus Mycobacterium methanotrophicum]UQX11268.1 transposase [Candidatus Mycobacterium methanotrophicum]